MATLLTIVGISLLIALHELGHYLAARAFDMRVLYFNRRRRPEVEQELGVEYRSFDEILAESDYVMLCCPLTAETRNLIDAAALAKMKPTGVLVNIARGGVVDTQALYEALRDRKIYAAGLDVTEPEPLPRDHPMLGLDNVTIMPHLGSATVETRREMARNSVENLMRGLKKAAGQDAKAAANLLNKEDAAALSAIGLAASAGYYMEPSVRKLIGYPGQESRPGNPDETPAYVTNGMLKQVSDRGPIFKPTPKS